MKNNKKMAIALIIGACLMPHATLAKSKIENVYTHLDYSGEVYKSVVSNHLYVDQKSLVTDDSILENILNLNGDETYLQNGDKITWETKGKDIFYEGVTSKELPLSVKATYYLDDVEMDPNDMIGKNGRVKITYRFFNNSYFKSKKMYQPLMVLLASVYDNENNKVEKVLNGRVMDTGNKSYVLGISSPGLYDNTGIGEFKDMDRIVLEYDTKAFSLKEVYIVATPKLVDDLDLSVFDKMDKLNKAINLLSSNMDDVSAGAHDLTMGLGEIVKGCEELDNGLKEVVNSVQLLLEGSKKIDEGLLQVLNRLKEVKSILDDENVSGSLKEVEQLIGKNTEVINLLKKNPSGNEEMIGLLMKNNEALSKLLLGLQSVNDKVMKTISVLESALAEIEDGTSILTKNLEKLKLGINKLWTGENRLCESLQVAYNGSDTLDKGISLINKDGIKVLESNMKKINSYSNKIKDVIKLSKDYNGFATNTAFNTTFVYKMEGLY